MCQQQRSASPEVVLSGIGIVAQPGQVEIGFPELRMVVLRDKGELDVLLNWMISAMKLAFPQVGRFDFIDPREVV